MLPLLTTLVTHWLKCVMGKELQYGICFINEQVPLLQPFQHPKLAHCNVFWAVFNDYSGTVINTEHSHTHAGG